MRALLLAGLAAAVSPQAQLQAQSQPQSQPKSQAFTLPNGLRVLLLEDHEHPLVRMRLHLRVEPKDIPPGHQGLPQLALRMVTCSDAGDLKAEELDRLQEDSGIQQTQAAAASGLDWQLVARSRDQDRALGLLANRLLRAIFDPAQLEEQRLACWQEEERREEDPFLRLRRRLGQDPRSRPTMASLGAITWEDLLGFRARVFRPDRAVLVLHGDLGLEQAKRLVLLSLGTWTPQEVRAGSSLTEAMAPGPSMPSGPLWIAPAGAETRVQVVAPRPADLLSESAVLLDLLVSGEPPRAALRLEAGPDGIVATDESETPPTAALSRLLERLESQRQRGFTQADLERARKAWASGRSLASLHPGLQMERALQEALGRGPSSERMGTLKLEQLNEDFRRWLDPANLRTGGLRKASAEAGAGGQAGS